VSLFTQEDIRAARSVDVLSFLRRNDPGALVPLGNGSYCTREHDSLKISNGMWYWFSRGIGGKSAVDYLTTVENMDFADAVRAVLEKTIPVIAHEKPKNAETRVLHLPKKNDTASHVKAYLKGRGISESVILYCLNHGLLYESQKHHSAVFVGYDCTGTARYAAIRGTSDNYKGDAGGSDKRFSFRLGTASTCVHLFEAAIDALSYATLMEMEGVDWRNASLLSLAGVFKSKRENALPAALEQYLADHPNTQTVYLHLDNDETGRSAAAGIANALKNKYKVVDAPPPEGKDVNDFLLIQQREFETGGKDTMNIRIYQINMDRDTERKAFEGLDNLKRLWGSPDIDSSLYDKVYEGEVDCDSLEGVYSIFNAYHPEDYRGRSLSVSDVVEVIDPPKIVGEIENNSGRHSYTNLADYMSAQDNYREMDVDFTAHDYVGLDKYLFEPGFYFCDSIGFQKVDFDPAETQNTIEMKTIKVVLLEPGKVARIADIDSSLEGLQRTVGGDIEAFYPFTEECCVVCAESGKIEGMPLNRAIREEDTEVEMTYGEMVRQFREAERNGRHLDGYVVFTQDSFQKEYPVEGRTYHISSNNKAFQPNMGGYSIYGSALDGSDPFVRLDGYMANENGGSSGWKIERCYRKEPGRDIIDIIAGTFFICDCSGESFGSLSEEQLKRYAEKYRNPERFVRINDAIQAIPYKPAAEQER